MPLSIWNLILAVHLADRRHPHYQLAQPDRFEEDLQIRRVRLRPSQPPPTSLPPPHSRGSIIVCFVFGCAQRNGKPEKMI